MLVPSLKKEIEGDQTRTKKHEAKLNTCRPGKRKLERITEGRQKKKQKGTHRKRVERGKRKAHMVDVLPVW